MITLFKAGLSFFLTALFLQKHSAQFVIIHVCLLVPESRDRVCFPLLNR